MSFFTVCEILQHRPYVLKKWARLGLPYPQELKQAYLILEAQKYMEPAVNQNSRQPSSRPPPSYQLEHGGVRRGQSIPNIITSTVEVTRTQTARGSMPHPDAPPRQCRDQGYGWLYSDDVISWFMDSRLFGLKLNHISDCIYF